MPESLPATLRRSLSARRAQHARLIFLRAQWIRPSSRCPQPRLLRAIQLLETPTPLFPRNTRSSSPHSGTESRRTLRFVIAPSPHLLLARVSSRPLLAAVDFSSSLQFLKPPV